MSREALHAQARDATRRAILAEALVHDAISTTIAGLRAGAATHAVTPHECGGASISPDKES